LREKQHECCVNDNFIKDMNDKIQSLIHKIEKVVDEDEPYVSYYSVIEVIVRRAIDGRIGLDAFISDIENSWERVSSRKAK
jgi:hypothetical protein